MPTRHRLARPTVAPRILAPGASVLAVTVLFASMLAVSMLAGCAGARRDASTAPDRSRPLALSVAPDGVLFAVADGGVLRSRAQGALGPAVALDRWGSLPNGEEATDIDASDALVVRVALREGAVAVLDRETGTLRERLTLDALRSDGRGADGLGTAAPGAPAGGTPGSERLPARIDLVALRALPDGSVVGLLEGAEPVVVRWDAARQASVWATAASLPAGAFDIERDGGDLVVLGANGQLVWLDRLGTPLARRTALSTPRPVDAVALGRTEAGVVLVGGGGAWRIGRSGGVGAFVPLAEGVRAVEPLTPGGVAVLTGVSLARVAVRADRWALPDGRPDEGPERRSPAP